MTKEVVQKIVKGITDKIECNTADIDDWAEFWGFTREEYEEFLDTAIKAIEQQSNTWSLDDAREDFMCDVYNVLDFLPTNNEANRIIDSFDRVTSGLKRESCEDCISRADAKKYLSAPDANGDRIIYESDLDLLPPVQPKYNTSEWCHDCSEYNHVKHCCPRFNRVIRNAIEEIKEPKVGHCKDCKYFEYDHAEDALESKWIPISERVPKTAGVYRVTRYYPNNAMNPNYLVDACYFDGSDTWYNDNRINHERAYADNVIAWQENPEPYRAESEEEDGNDD